VDLTVRGIITPNACTPSLSSGGVIDHGKMSAKDLNATQITPLPKVNLQMTVTCDAPVVFALKATDNRAGSGNASGFGLGRINGTQKLGSYSLTMSAPLADGEVGDQQGAGDGDQVLVHGCVVSVLGQRTGTRHRSAERGAVGRRVSSDSWPPGEVAGCPLGVRRNLAPGGGGGNTRITTIRYRSSSPASSRNRWAEL